jgi:hypothetical protein
LSFSKSNPKTIRNMTTSFITIEPDRKCNVKHLSGFKEIVFKSIEKLPSNVDELTIAFYDAKDNPTIDVKLEIGTMQIPENCSKIEITNYSEEVIKIFYELVPFIDNRAKSFRT